MPIYSVRLGNRTIRRQFKEINLYFEYLSPSGGGMCIDARSIPNSSPSGAKGVYGAHVVRHLSPRWGSRDCWTPFSDIPVAPLVLRCDLPKPRRGERCIRRTKLTLMVQLGKRTYRPGNRKIGLIWY